MTSASGPTVIGAVRLVDDETTVCRRCQAVIGRGRRVAFIVGIGNVCLQCLLRSHAGEHEADLVDQVGEPTDAGRAPAAPPTEE